MRLLRTGEVAKRIGVHRETVRLWCKSGYLPAIKVGAHYRIREDHLEDWQRTHANSD